VDVAAEIVNPTEVGSGIDIGQLRALHRLAVAVHGATSAGAFYEETLDVVITLLHADRASLLLFDPDGVMRCKGSRGLSAPYRQAVEGHRPWSPGDVDAKPILVPDVLADGDLRDLAGVFEAEGIRALAFVPLIAERLLGQFMLCYDRPYACSAAELAVAELLATHVALGVERREREASERAARRDAEESAARLARLQRITADLARAITLTDVADVVLGGLMTELGTSTASLCLLDGDELELTCAVGYQTEVLDHWRRFPLDAPLPASDAVRTGEAVFLSSPEERDRRYPVMAGGPLVDASAAFAMIPLTGKVPLGCLVLGFPQPRPFGDQDASFFFLLAARCAGALERARLFDEQDRRRARAGLVADVAAVLAGSFDVDENVAAVARLVVPDLADGCAVHLYGEARTRPRVAAVHHHDPGRIGTLRHLAEAYPPRLHQPGTAPARRPRVVVRPTMTEEVLADMAVSPEHLELLRSAQFGSALVVTLGARGRAVGALSLFNDGGRRLAADALEVAEELAGRLGVAIDNSRLFRERTEIARTLQTSLLPPDLPAVPGLEIAARYTAGGAGIDVGGDFYDVFPLDQGRHVFVLGDVCGRGVQAATTAALTRHTIRSAAITQPTPAAILGHVNDVLLRSQPSDVDEPRFCTVVVGTITPERDGFLIDLAVGGHPLPLLRRADGTVTPVGTVGSVLGIVDDPEATTSRVPIGPGDLVVAVTDGILEMRRDHEEFGEDGVRRVLAHGGGADAAAVAEAVEMAAVNFASRPPSDDLAVLVLRVAPGPTR
jgi:serine phosphatase RsbU (regulator of sigma subunit)/uncharacterized protein YigA (DUF484 family)